MNARAAVPLLILTVFAAPATARAARPVVTEVILRAPPGEDVAMLRALVEVKVGDRLRAAVVGRAVQRLYGVGRFSNVIVRTVPVSGSGRAGETDRVKLVIDCIARRTIRTINITGEGAPLAIDEPELRKATGLLAGDEFDAGRLERAGTALRAFYQRRGYRAAQLKTRVTGESDVTIDLLVNEGAQTRVKSLSYTGAGKYSPGPGVELKTRPGEILDEDALLEDVRSIRDSLRKEGYYRSRVNRPIVEVVDGSADVQIQIRLGPSFAFRFTGASVFSDRVLRREIGFDEDQPIDETLLEEAAGRLTAFYRRFGFYEARVSGSEMPFGADVVLLFGVEEGRRYRLGSVRFPGTQFHNSEWLVSRVKELLDEIEADEPDRGRTTSPEGISVEPPDLRSIYYAPSWDGALERLLEIYRSEGLLGAELASRHIAVDERQGVIDLEIEIREGPRTMVKSLSFIGNDEISVEDLKVYSKLSEGDPLSLAAVEQTRLDLLSLYARRGFPYARVEAEEDYSSDKTAADLRYRIDEGPKVKIGKLLVAGNRRTQSEVIAAAVTIRPGDTYDPEEMTKSQAALLALGVFRSATLRLSAPEVPQSEKDMAVDLVEGPWQAVSLGGGFSVANGPRAFLEYSRPNMLGRAIEFTARAKVNYPTTVFRADLKGKRPIDRVEGRVSTGLHSRRLYFLPVPLGARVDVIAERLHRRAYDLTRIANVIGFSLPLSPRIAASLDYELEVDNIRRSSALSSLVLTPADLERLRFPEGITTLHSLGPSITADYRDNPMYPRSGWYANLTADLSRSLGNSGHTILFGLLPGSDVDTNMLKLSGTLSGYLPAGPRSSFAVSLRGGRVLPLSSTSVTIPSKRFFMGGANSLRGYAEDEVVPQDLRAEIADQVNQCGGSISGLACSSRAQQLASGKQLVSEGGESFLLLKGEFRFPLRGNLEGGLFTDFGNLWLDPRETRLTPMRADVGVGLRFVTPIGPASLDLGFNIKPDPYLNERLFAPHFSIGLF